MIMPVGLFSNLSKTSVKKIASKTEFSGRVHHKTNHLAASRETINTMPYKIQFALEKQAASFI